MPVIAGSALTLVGLGVGVGYHFAARSDKDDAQSIVAEIGRGTCGSPASPPECARIKELAESHENHRNLSTAGFIVGGVSAVGTVAYFLLARPDQQAAERSSLRIGATAAPSGGSFALMGWF